MITKPTFVGPGTSSPNAKQLSSNFFDQILQDDPSNMRDLFDPWDFDIKRPMLPLVRAFTFPFDFLLIINLASRTRCYRSATYYQREKESAKPNVYTTRQVYPPANY
jgi:hypothetical protein